MAGTDQSPETFCHAPYTVVLLPFYWYSNPSNKGKAETDLQGRRSIQDRVLLVALIPCGINGVDSAQHLTGGNAGTELKSTSKPCSCLQLFPIITVMQWKG